MSTSVVPPNERVRSVYRQLSDLLAESDDAFIERGPEALRAATGDDAFFENVETERADGEYTRRLVYREPDGPVVRYMEWPPEYSLMPHEHHGRPCFELLVDGCLFLADMRAEQVDEGEYALETVGTNVCEPGDAGVVDPRTGTDIHAVYSPVRSRSLHVYPDDNHFGIGYVRTGDGDRYARSRFELD